MLYRVWCIKNNDYEIEAKSADEAIAKAKRMCPFYPDEVEVECINEEEEEEDE